MNSAVILVVLLIRQKVCAAAFLLAEAVEKPAAADEALQALALVVVAVVRAVGARGVAAVRAVVAGVVRGEVGGSRRRGCWIRWLHLALR